MRTLRKPTKQEILKSLQETFGASKKAARFFSADPYTDSLDGYEVQIEKRDAVENGFQWLVSLCYWKNNIYTDIKSEKMTQAARNLAIAMKSDVAVWDASRYPDEVEPYVRFNEKGDKEYGWLDTDNGEWHSNLEPESEERN